MEYIIILIVILIAFILVFVIQKNAKQQISATKEEAKTERKKWEQEINTLHKKQMDDVETIAQLRATLSAKEELLQAQQNEVANIREQMNKDFQILATRILEEKTTRFTDTNKANIDAILKPLNEKLAEFKTKVEETYDKESKQRFSLEEKIKDLVALNNRISEDANNLTKALKGNNKIQGNWGEMILESILEKSGLKKSEEYYTQDFIKNDSGERIRNDQNQYMQPDIIVAYPGGRKIVIDSKVSLNAYVRYVESESDTEKAIAEKEHITSIKKHIDELSLKSYQDYIDSLDFVMMFIPNEPAYILAMQLDTTLWDYAYRKRILLISPTNLIASLKVVSDLWKREYQSRNAQEIAKRGAILYDKFAGFVETLQDVGKNIERTQKSYDKAFGQLKDGNGNLIRQAEMLKELGVKSQKELPDSQ
ncbi:DNA recombination protein RmuC [Dysgonomonas sp. PH5-45]|uniref:DNA recombination protein RmuC n=1 Tax=unclassified Dysgonomonas TaxID=2630389 RepID=UPI002474E7A5|nr:MULTISPECIES: DNA recombination protein RmuC [unclassified Dysgonomonas]MDH6354942.1 DNA recombination protein RmuC [Dysgonomonas sp. PH5-45]MDH6387841.1 DNA recombination protein RmuC [Dysgonomonas sp. PH5-37]